MAPGILWYPDADGPLRTISFDRSVSRLDPQPNPQVSDVYSGGQMAWRSFFGMRYNLRIVVEKYRGGDQTFERKICDLQSHLAAGGFVAFTYDTTKAWAAKLTGLPTVSDTVVHHASGNAFLNWGATDLAVDDQVVIEGDWGSSWRAQHTRLDAYASHQTTIEDALIYSYPTLPILRYRWFWPTLRQAETAPKALIQTDYRLHYTIDLNLEYLPAAMFALFQGTTSTAYSGGSDGALPFRGTAATNAPAFTSIERRIATVGNRGNPFGLSWR